MVSSRSLIFTSAIYLYVFITPTMPVRALRRDLNGVKRKAAVPKKRSEAKNNSSSSGRKRSKVEHYKKKQKKQIEAKHNGIFVSEKLNELKDFPDGKDHLGIINRETPVGSRAFFRKLFKRTTFDEAQGKVCKIHAKSDIRRIVEKNIPKVLRKQPFYEIWLSDMADVCKTFCDALKSEAITFWVGSDRGCVRYHVDWVPYRMLVTYHGRGTELLPDGVTDRKAFLSLESDQIVDPKARKFLQPWDVALFRGGPDGVVHRTPDAALDAPTVLMRLDRKEFLDAIRESEKVIEGEQLKE
mmetsp:Transcript_5652/g.8336  ORF Transcript_5652/g.8336 Transcript_5652/m.8336 type:complete len:298 (-) Transcript_5652:14-907(-)